MGGLCWEAHESFRSREFGADPLGKANTFVFLFQCAFFSSLLYIHTVYFLF